MKKYELWLDETGDFSPEQQIEGSRGDKVYSLIGGVLIPAGKIDNQYAKKLVGNEIGHATEMENNLIHKDLLPALCDLKEKEAQFVFFENRQRITQFDKVDLYLEMMVEGLLQLISYLSIFDKEFQLDILIAVRYVSCDEILTQITRNQYYERLKKSLLHKLGYGYMDVDDDVTINIMFASAREEPKLMLADYVCGARRAFLRTSDNRYTKKDKDLLSSLFCDDFCFDCYEYLLMGQVKNKLADNKLADAIILFCDDKGLLKHLPKSFLTQNKDCLLEKTKRLIFQKMNQLGKQEVLCQIEELLEDIRISIQMEEEYEWGEIFLKKIKDNFLGELKRFEEYEGKIEIEISLCYAYLYLKEGDVKQLKMELLNAENLFKTLPQCMDFVKYKISIWILQLNYFLMTYNFEQAEKYENKIISFMNNMEDLFVLAGVWNDNDAIVSNFRQQEIACLREKRLYYNLIYEIGDKRETVECLREASEKWEAFPFWKTRMFPEGCYYFLIYEKNFEKALKWLLLFVGIEVDNLSDPEIVKIKSTEFCKILIEMDGKQKTELLKYYMSLIYSMKKYGLEGDEQPYSSILYQSIEETKLLHIVLERDCYNTPIIQPVSGRWKVAPYKHVIRQVLSDYKEKIYHPVEQIWGQLASYLALCGTDRIECDVYYKKAIQICDENEEYSIMQVNKLFILSAMIGKRLLGEGECNTEKLLKEMEKEYYNILQSDFLPVEIKDYLQNIYKDVMKTIKKGVSKKAEQKKMGKKLISISEGLIL